MRPRVAAAGSSRGGGVLLRRAGHPDERLEEWASPGRPGVVQKVPLPGEQVERKLPPPPYPATPTATRHPPSPTAPPGHTAAMGRAVATGKGAARRGGGVRSPITGTGSLGVAGGGAERQLKRPAPLLVQVQVRGRCAPRGKGHEGVQEEHSSLPCPRRADEREGGKDNEREGEKGEERAARRVREGGWQTLPPQRDATDPACQPSSAASWGGWIKQTQGNRGGKTQRSWPSGGQRHDGFSSRTTPCAHDDHSVVVRGWASTRDREGRPQTAAAAGILGRKYLCARGPGSDDPTPNARSLLDQILAECVPTCASSALQYFRSFVLTTPS